METTAITCIKKCGRKAGATPELCFPCLKRIATEWYEFNHPTVARYEYIDYYIKNYLNKLQRKTKKARKRHG